VLTDLSILLAFVKCSVHREWVGADVLAAGRHVIL